MSVFSEPSQNISSLHLSYSIQFSVHSDPRLRLWSSSRRLPRSTPCPPHHPISHRHQASTLSIPGAPCHLHPLPWPGVPSHRFLPHPAEPPLRSLLLCPRQPDPRHLLARLRSTPRLSWNFRRRTQLRPPRPWPPWPPASQRPTRNLWWFKNGRKLRTGH